MNGIQNSLMSNTVDATQQTGTNNNDDASALTNASNNILGKDAFFKLLITQLQNQDPLKPMDDKEFISQMAQFSSLEQMQGLNQQMSKFINLKAAADGASLIGKKVASIITSDGQEETISGIVEKIEFSDGDTLVVLDNGTKINMDQISSITS